MVYFFSGTQINGATTKDDTSAAEDKVLCRSSRKWVVASHLLLLLSLLCTIKIIFSMSQTSTIVVDSVEAKDKPLPAASVAPVASNADELQEAIDKLTAEVEKLKSLFSSQSASSEMLAFTSKNESQAEDINRMHVQDALPTCQELMQHPHSPFANGAFLTSHLTQVVWNMRKDGSRELTLPLTCSLKRYTSTEAKQCLAGKKILFVGDSLTRYNYLSLAYFLEQGHWPHRFIGGHALSCVGLTSDKCKAVSHNVCSARRWGGWVKYIQSLGGTDRDGSDGPFRGRMEVLLVRKEINGVSPSGRFEYVSSSSPKTVLRYNQEVGWEGTEPYKGWNYSGCAHNGSCRYPRDLYDRRQNGTEGYDWEYDNTIQAYMNTTELFAQEADADFAVYNRGHWGKLPTDKAKSMMESMQKLTGGKEGKEGRCFFRSTTGSAQIKPWKHELQDWEYGGIREIVFEESCEFLDYGWLTEEFRHMVNLGLYSKATRNVTYERSSVFVDVVHYHPWVYEELNNLLLNVLCNTNNS